MVSVHSYDERDDIEKILVTPDGDSVITLSTNHRISIKQWNTYVSFAFLITLKYLFGIIISNAVIFNHFA